MQPETDFTVHFYFVPSTEYANQLQSFINKSIDSYTGDFKPPFVYFQGCNQYLILEGLRKRHR